MAGEAFGVLNFENILTLSEQLMFKWCNNLSTTACLGPDKEGVKENTFMFGMKIEGGRKYAIQNSGSNGHA